MRVPFLSGTFVWKLPLLTNNCTWDVYKVSITAVHLNVFKLWQKSPILNSMNIWSAKIVKINMCINALWMLCVLKMNEYLIKWWIIYSLISLYYTSNLLKYEIVLLNLVNKSAIPSCFRSNDGTYFSLLWSVTVHIILECRKCPAKKKLMNMHEKLLSTNDDILKL